MKHTLIHLKEGYIIVSDEKQFNTNDYVADGFKIIQLDDNDFESDFGDTINTDKWKKLIAGYQSLPTIDFSNLTDEECRRIGWVDVEKLAYDNCQAWEHFASAQGGYIKGFKQAQSMNSKMFTKSDLREAIRMYRNGDFINLLKADDEIIQSLSTPKQFPVEVEINDNSVKILKLL